MDGMIGRKIEENINSMMEISELVAGLQMKLEEANKDITMLSTLNEINQYMSENLDIHKLIPAVEDVIHGMVGANYAVVLLENQYDNRSYQYHDLNYENINHIISNSLFVPDLSIDSYFGLEKGCLYLYRISIAENEFGFIVVYWELTLGEKDNKVKLLNILSNQVGLLIKNAKLMEKLTNMVLHDPLTGLCNRTKLNNIENNSIPSHEECTIMFDIDDFKKINDNNGHIFGDEILKTFSSILRKASQDPNISCFRYGGEEFVVKCIGGENEGIQIANFIREDFFDKTGYTVSAGISSIGSSCKIQDYKLLIELADTAMYVSKQSGKNKVTSSNPDIQLLNVAKDELCILMDEIYKNPSSLRYNLIRLDITNNHVFSLLEYESFKKSLQAICEKTFVTESLTCLMITEKNADISYTIQMIKDMFAIKYPSFSYVISDCNSIFDEVSLHSTRVSNLVSGFGEYTGQKEDDINALKIACAWHDIGKLCIDPRIYSKKGKLTEEEFSRIKHHAWIGYSIAKQTPNLKYCAEWILMHHENVDGTGYYRHSGKTISNQAKIMGLFDKFDALTEDRCYRKSFSTEDALKILMEEQDKFDTHLFEQFIAFIQHIIGPEK